MAVRTGKAGVFVKGRPILPVGDFDFVLNVGDPAPTPSDYLSLAIALDHPTALLHYRQRTPLTLHLSTVERIDFFVVSTTGGVQVAGSIYKAA